MARDLDPEFCHHARVWLDFLYEWTPRSCPYRMNPGSSCLGGSCGYYENREPTRHYRRKMKSLKGG